MRMPKAGNHIQAETERQPIAVPVVGALFYEFNRCLLTPSFHPYRDTRSSFPVALCT